ncbi:hypothetical protein Golax_025262 [Gossypium laxum]|uniref:gibberellin 3beta-dioxygenase n=1 Tax=Gossypium laxum TaxID=34288 RepID=A0A7J8ZEK4_9ROSI|nr:hypothetical protein [Gossypium laxum]
MILSIYIYVCQALLPKQQYFHCFQMNPTVKLQTQTFNNVPTLPDSYVWSTTPSESPCLHSIDEKQVPPVVDIGDPSAFSLVRDACEKWGVFQAINHGIPLSLFQETEFEARRLFSLPTEQKQLVARLPEGFTGYGLVRISRNFPKLMWSECFGMIGSPVEHASQLWPQDHAKFCEVMEQFQVELKTLCEKLVAVMLRSLGLTNEQDTKWFEPKNESDRAKCFLQLNSYPVCPDPDRAMGLAPHTDSSLFTLLYQGGINGLQVYDDGVGWVDVQPVEGALVVNVGDLMHIVSNGRFKSVLHRVVVNNTRHRISTAFFYLPPWDAKVSPLKKLVEFDHLPMYRQVTWKEYVETKTKDLSKALDSIRI